MVCTLKGCATLADTFAVICEVNAAERKMLGAVLIGRADRNLAWVTRVEV
jgi:hypothetical protein